VYNEQGEDPIRDFGFTLSPSFTATMRGRLANVSLTSTTDLVYFATQRAERSANQGLTATVRLSVRRLSPFAEAGYINTRERMSEEIDARARRIERTGAAGLDVRITPKVSGIARFEVSRMAFDGDARFDGHSLAQELNRETQTASAGVRYALTPLTAVVATTEASRVRFSQIRLRDTDSHQAQVGVSLHPRALVSGSARVGYQTFRPRLRTVPDFSGFVGAANVTYRLRESTALGFMLDRLVSFSYLPDEPYYVRVGYGLSVRRQLVPQWDVTVTAARSRHEYRRSGLGPGAAAIGHSDRLFGGTIALGYEVGPRTRITTAISYQTRRSASDDRSYDGFRIGTSFTYGL
jgi:hypothetical protein